MVNLADCLGEQTGPLGRWLFLAGAWAAVFSSLLGVWQSVPYIYADFCRLWHYNATPPPVSTEGRAYRLCLYAVALVPMLGLAFTFKRIQLLYAFIGAGFMPLLALTLLLLNGQPRLVGREGRNRPITIAILVAVVLFFSLVGWFEIRKAIGF